MNDGVKTIGVLTSGGDAPGMNAAIRAVVRAAIAKWSESKGDPVVDMQDFWKKRSLTWMHDECILILSSAAAQFYYTAQL